MARRGQGSGLHGHQSTARTPSHRSGTWFSLTGCFIIGIFVISGVVLYSMHYTVQIGSYFQQAAKFRRSDFPRLSTFQHVVQQALESKSDSTQLHTNGHESPSKEEGDEVSLEEYGDIETISGDDDGDDDDAEGSIEQYEYGYIDDESGAADDDADDADDDGDDDDADDYIDDQREADDDDDDDDAAIVPAPENPHPTEAESELYGYFEPTSRAPATANNVKPNPKESSAATNKVTEKNDLNKASLPAAESTNGQAGSTTKKKPKRPRDPYNYVVNIDPNWGVKGEWDLKYIQVMPTNKPLLKKDRRVVFPNFTSHLTTAAIREPPSGIPGAPRELTKANAVLERHPLYHNKAFDKHDHTLEEVMYYIKNSPTCAQQPIYLTMATVGDDLYWQLIENFVYTLVKFEVSECSLVICVSDLRCMKMCDAAKFPCYNYVSEQTPLPSVMEQIAQVKLLHVPKALNRGVDVFMLDLDVGFLESPKHMVQAFVETPIVDIFVQEDYIFIMNRTKAGWGKYFTEPLPNIGLFLCRGNNRTARVFELAWNKYLGMTDPYEKSQPGRDQNHVLDSMRIGRGTFGLKYAYFSTETAPLLDKLVLREGNTMELGGEAIQGYLDAKQSVAMHTTCYEKSTKVMGLKASNAFWNPRYYDPLRRTITKQILFVSEEQLLDEVRSLVWLALSTDRALIIPNILGSEALGSTFKSYKDQVMWPGFRVSFLKRTKGRNDLKVDILEPAYYWRINRDYDPIPEAKVVYFDPEENLMRVREEMERVEDAPRVIVHPRSRKKGSYAARFSDEESLRVWANDSVGTYPLPYALLKSHYQRLPSVKSIRAVRGVRLVQEVLQGMRNCNNIFGKVMGTRTCFQICD